MAKTPFVWQERWKGDFSCMFDVNTLDQRAGGGPSRFSPHDPGTGPLPGYQSAAYYRSLIAEARSRWTVLPVRTICDSWLDPLPRQPASRGNGIALLCDPDDHAAPSDDRSNRYFRRLASRHGIRVEIIGPGDLPELSRFGALWIRCHTSPRSLAYAFARHAEEMDLPVIDDSAAILTCGNKIFTAERLAQHAIPVPKSLIISDSVSVAEIEAALTYPMVVKSPDGSFSKSVARADSRAALEVIKSEMLNTSHLILLQEYMPTAFDWRIGLIGGEPLFACQYRMVRGHWQILKHREGKAPIEGPFRAIPLPDVPPPVLAAAIAASKAMGGGLHGVDIKETARGVFVIEVNDNPNLNHGIEDRVEGALPWLKILNWFQTEQLKRSGKDTAVMRAPVQHGRSARLALPRLRNAS